MFVSLVIGFKLARVSFEKETCYRTCSWARPELVLGFFVCANLGGQLGSWGVRQVQFHSGLCWDQPAARTSLHRAELSSAD